MIDWRIMLPILALAAPALASGRSDIEGAQAWIRESVNSSLTEEQLSKESKSYRAAAGELWHSYYGKYSHLSGLDFGELDERSLPAAAEIFTTMASVGTKIPRNSDSYPAVRETVEAAFLVFQEIIARRRPTLEEAALTYSTIFGLREWELERRMRDILDPMHKPPHIIDDPGIGASRSLWVLDSDFFTMKRIAYDLPEETRWIVIAFADCAVAKEAVLDIKHNPDLMRMFAGRSLWLTPPGQDALSFPGVFVWNARHPDFELKFIHHLDEWPMLDMRLDSPTFIRIDHGKVVGVHSGWGTAEYLSKTRDALLDIEALIPSKSR